MRGGRPAESFVVQSLNGPWRVGLLVRGQQEYSVAERCKLPNGLWGKAKPYSPILGVFRALTLLVGRREEHLACKN